MFTVHNFSFKIAILPQKNIGFPSDVQ